ncbi:SH3 domain-containing protein [Thauera sinica]|uniref:SH3 domain-containing protein n=1 Tax=Thauera sp. K11 TaxID=2005884 RepID=UPI001E4D8D2E|nr:SH3 domain-containing protein [Thauera sp. K11]
MDQGARTGRLDHLDRTQRTQHQAHRPDQRDAGGGAQAADRIVDGGVRGRQGRRAGAFRPPAEGWAKVRHTDGASGYVRVNEVWGL